MLFLLLLLPAIGDAYAKLADIALSLFLSHTEGSALLRSQRVGYWCMCMCVYETGDAGLALPFYEEEDRPQSGRWERSKRALVGLLQLPLHGEDMGCATPRHTHTGTNRHTHTQAHRCEPRT